MAVGVASIGPGSNVRTRCRGARLRGILTRRRRRSRPRWRAPARATLANAEDRPLYDLLFAAFGGIVAALLESTVIPYLRIGDAQPHLLFVLAIIVTVVGGFDRGLVFAFVGGLFLDVFTQRPLGISAFALLLSVGGVALLSRVMSRARPLVPIVATGVGLVYSMSLSSPTQRSKLPHRATRWASSCHVDRV